MSTSHWTPARLGDVLKRSKEQVKVEDERVYKRVTIRLGGQGVAVRDEVPGTDIGTKKQFVIRNGQFILSKIDALNGAFGVVGPRCDGAIITGNFWTFDVNQSILNATFFNLVTKTPSFVDFCVRASSGTTNRRYLQEARFLKQEIRLPPPYLPQVAR